MIETIGNLSISLAILASAASVLCAMASVRGQSAAHARAARYLIAVYAAMITTAAGALLAALFTSDFRFSYVAGYTEQALPWGYKFAALWAGQEGSLLLWAWILGVLCTIAVLGWRSRVLALPNRIETVYDVQASAPAATSSPDAEFAKSKAIATAVLAAVCGFFAVLLLFTANPFQITADPPIHGRGLNPQLQDIGMIIHPPLLFTGYAGFTIPFAMLVGVLLSNPRENRWLALIRPWALFSWMFLGAGIVMGAWWAYVELGWGGYWAWDPVENASLLPWLTGTALLHSIIVQQHRGMFKIWNACLIAGTFVLCILGTYLTRSGVIDSVHAFSGSLLGRFFLVFLCACTLASIVLIVWRLKDLRSPRRLEGLVSREGVFLASNVLLVIMMLTTLIGTTFPLISAVFVLQPVTVKPGFYNSIVAPMGIALVGLMAMGPALAFGVQAARKIARSLLIPGVASLVTTCVALMLVTHNFWALACVAIVVLGTATVVVDFLRSLHARRRSTGEFWPLCALRLIDKDHRRYGGQLSHLGVMMIVIGVAGSSLFSSQAIHRLTPGSTAEIDPGGRYSLKFIALQDVRETNYSAVRATIELSDAQRVIKTLTPERRFYDAWMDQPISEVAVRSTWREDVYVSLAGWEASGSITTLEVKVNPLVLWIWIGGTLMAAGSLFCILPRLLPAWQTNAARRIVGLDEPAMAGALGSVATAGVLNVEVSK